jgi:hypothetical protein
MQLNAILFEKQITEENINLLETISKTLSDNGAKSVKIAGNEILFEGPPLNTVTGFNPLAGVTDGKIRVEKDRMFIKLNASHLAVSFYIAIAVMVGVFFIFLNTNPQNFIDFLVFFLFGVFVFFGYFGNRWLFYFRFMRMLNKIIQ